MLLFTNIFYHTKTFNTIANIKKYIVNVTKYIANITVWCYNAVVARLCKCLNSCSVAFVAFTQCDLKNMSVLRQNGGFYGTYDVV